MKLTEEQAKQITAKVHKDLKLDCDDRFPIEVIFVDKNRNIRRKFDYWTGRYDYSKPPEEGIKTNRSYSYEPVIIDDEKGIAIGVSFFPYDSPIELNKEGNYVWSKE